MIDRIEIAGCTSYGDAVELMDGLRAVNFIYGANGAGKTTLSRLISDSSPFSKCAVFWRNNHKLQSLVYNRDFVRENFNQSSKLKGIFTLGKQDIEVQNKIVQAKAESDASLTQIAQLNAFLEGNQGGGGKRAELAAIEDSFREACWKFKIKHNDKLKEALRGFLGNKESFKERLVREYGKTRTRPLLTQSQLEDKAASLFGDTPAIEEVIPLLNYADFLKLEGHPVLSRRIIGKTDVDIAGVIQKLGNSDWVRQGMPYLVASEKVCPFCQQQVSNRLAVSLAEYFDETFLKETAALVAVEQGYRLVGERLQQAIRAFSTSSLRFMDLGKVNAEANIFDARFAMNSQNIAAKVKEPSQILSLEPLAKVLQTLEGFIEAANEKIAAHNLMVANLNAERSKLSDDVWAFLAHSELSDKHQAYCVAKGGIEKAIQSLSNQIQKAQDIRTEREQTIRRLEKTITSIQPTVNEINQLLSGFGFRGFYLEALKDNSYRLRRADGSDAQETLSEGERSFITFLYFFYLLKGSTSEAGLSSDRVVVFDDPVSSLDSDVLFIVSSLIKQAIEEARLQSKRVKQVFVLTHNVYFFKEVVFDTVRSGDVPQKHETFWTIRKINDASSLKRHNLNPIKTSYDLMWAPLRQPNLADQSLQNNMRRILEHYFRILGGVSFDDIVNRFEGEEKLICRSLMSWVNDGSHSVPDDMFLSIDESVMQRYLSVFLGVFKKMGHTNHFNMMMGLPVSISAEVLN